MFEMESRESIFRIKGTSGDERWHYFNFPLAYLEMSPKLLDFDTCGQYIGMEDMEGSNIFEGDVVEHHQIIEEKGIDNLLGTYVVIFQQGRFVFHDPKHPEISGHYISPGSLKIVGTIYENPFLVA